MALDLGFIPVVQSLKTRVEPCASTTEMHRRRNGIERFFSA